MTFRTLAAALCFVAGGPAVHAEIRVDLFGTDPPPAATSDGRFTLIPFAPDPRPVFQDVDGIPAAQTPYGGFVDFASPLNLNHRRIGEGWAGWSHGFDGDVYFSGLDAGEVVIDLPSDAGAFSFYIQPNVQDVFTLRVEGRSASGEAIGRTVSVDGLSGAQGFGFWESSGGSLDSVTITDLSGGASDGFAVGEFCGAARLVAMEPPENNDACVGAGGGQTITISEDCSMIFGKLEERFTPSTDQPDTWLCVVDKNDRIIAENNDKGDAELFGKGNPWASAIWSFDGDDPDDVADVLVANGDGTYSLRLIVTGFPDGLDGDCDGFFQNAPHGEVGEFEVCVFATAGSQGGAEGPAPSPLITYREEFRTGAEAFRLNFTVPALSEIHIEIDNTVGAYPVCVDRDYFCLAGFEPLEEVFLTVVGGLDDDCAPTDTQLCWFDKDCNVIATDDDSGPAGGYSQLMAVADVNGVVCVGVSGGGDADCDGFLDDTQRRAGEEGYVAAAAPHGVCGAYLVKVTRSSTGGGASAEPSVEMEQVMGGDLNRDGGVDGRDLGLLISNWGTIF